jgi:hypothetical protein
MATHNIDELRKLINEVPLKEMDLDAKYYRVISIHGETLADCPTIHYARYFSRFSPKVVRELLDRLEAAERGARMKQRRAVRDTVKAYVIASTLTGYVANGSVLYYVGQGIDTNPDEQETVHEWSSNIEEAFPYLRERDAVRQKHVLIVDKVAFGELSIHPYNHSL